MHVTLHIIGSCDFNSFTPEKPCILLSVLFGVYKHQGLPALALARDREGQIEIEREEQQLLV